MNTRHRWSGLAMGGSALLTPCQTGTAAPREADFFAPQRPPPSGNAPGANRGVEGGE
jgi:hypothetical protein